MAEPAAYPPVPRARFLDRFIVLRGDGRAVSVRYGPADSNAGAVTAANPLWGDSAAIGCHLERLDALEPTDLVDLGIRLGAIALPQPVRDAFLRDVHTAGRTGQMVRLWISDDEDALGDLPWEFMYVEELADRAGRGFVALHPACSLLRHCRFADEDAHLVHGLDPQEPLRVLLVQADPGIAGLSPIAAHAQLDRIRQQLTHLGWLTTVRQLAPRGESSDPTLVATRANLDRELRTGAPHLVFLVAHGHFHPTFGESLIYLESDREGADAVGANDLAAMFGRRGGPRLILLDCCWSTSLARALCAPHRAVLGMQFAWPPASGPLFWNTLFSSLALSTPLEQCVFEAREAVNRNSLNTPDWGMPVLMRGNAAAPEPPPIVQQPFWRRDLVALRDRVSERDRDLIDELLRRLPEWGNQLGLASLVAQVDPLFVMLGGEDDHPRPPIITTPIWWTRLLAPPQAMEWSATGPGPWWVTVWVPGGDQLLFRETALPRLDLTDDDTRSWPRDVWLRWHVRQEPTRGRFAHALVRGAFLILDSALTESWIARMKKALSRKADRDVAGLEWLLREELYEGLLRRGSTLLRRSPDAPVRFAVLRLMAAAHVRIQRELSLLRIGHPESHWAAALARRHVEAGYRATAGWAVDEEARE